MVNKWPCLPAMCACVELWKAVTIFGSINVVYSAWLVGAYSYAAHKELGSGPLLRGAVSYQATVKLCVAFYCLEIIFSSVLVYGTHKRILICLRLFYYYALVMSVGSLMLQASQFFTMTSRHLDYLLIAHSLFGTVFQVYLMYMVKSLLNRFDPTVHHQFENQLEEVVATEWPRPGVAARVAPGEGQPAVFVEIPVEPDQNTRKVSSLVSINRTRNGDRKPILVEDIS